MKKLIYYTILFIFIMGCQANKTANIIETDHLIDWLPEREDVKAGAILVPENHNDPDGKKITITYIVIKAKDTASTKFPVIYFSGGPGETSLSLGAINYLLQQPIRNERDIILFDQRGIGYSSVFPDMSEGSFDIMTKDLNEKGELALMTELILEYKNKCTQLNIHPEYYNSIQNAKDVGLLFKYLGYKKYNLMGGSYGSLLGRVVQDMFPEKINSSVFVSPSPYRGDFLLDRLDNYSLALSRIFDYCENDPNCKNQYPKLKDDYLKAISILKDKPLTVSMNDSVNVVINAQDGIYLLRRLLYQNNSREKAPELIHAFINGGGKVINDVLLFERKIIGIVNISMLLSVVKYEYFNPDNTAEVIEEYYKNYPLLPVKMGFFDAFYQAGKNWHSASMPMKERKFQNSKIPTLIFANQYDPVTPPKNGYMFMETLSNGTFIVLDEGGHGGGDLECKDQVIIDFMNYPNKKINTSCLNIYKE